MSEDGQSEEKKARAAASLTEEKPTASMGISRELGREMACQGKRISGRPGGASQ